MKNSIKFIGKAKDLKLFLSFLQSSGIEKLSDLKSDIIVTPLQHPTHYPTHQTPNMIQ